MASSKKRSPAHRATARGSAHHPKKAPRPSPPARVAPASRPSHASARPKTKAVAAPPPVERASPPVPAQPSNPTRRHVLSLSFVRDGEEFLARLETNGGQISEFKNRALDQLLTLVAGELEDLLE